MALTSRSAPSSVGIVHQHRHAGLDARLDKQRLDVKVDLADLAQRGLDRRHHRGDDDVRHLARRQAVHLKEIDEEHAVLVHGLGAVRGDAPVRGQFGLFAVEPIEAEHRIRIADIESKQHVLSQRLDLRGANAAGLHRHQSICRAHQQKSILVEPGRNAGAGLRAVHFNAAAAHPG